MSTLLKLTLLTMVSSCCLVVIHLPSTQADDGSMMKHPSYTYAPSGKELHIATFPPEFWGPWSNNCTRGWEEDSGMMRIGKQRIEWWEPWCDLVSISPIENDPATMEITLACDNDSEKYLSTAFWKVTKMENLGRFPQRDLLIESWPDGSSRSWRRC